MSATTLADAPFTTSRWVSDATFVARSLRHSVRNSEALLMSILLPVMLMALFTYVFGGAIDPSGHYVSYVVPGAVLLCAGFGSSSTAVEVATDMTTGVIDRLRTMPIRAFGLMTGHVIAAVLRNAAATAIVIAVGLAMGFRPSASPLAWLGAVAVLLGYIHAITWLFAAIGLVSSSPDAANAYGFVLLFLPYLSSAFVPVASMPSWLRWVAENQPLTPIIETVRCLLLGQAPGAQAAWAIGWIAAITLVAILWARWVFGRKARG